MLTYDHWMAHTPCYKLSCCGRINKWEDKVIDTELSSELFRKVTHRA